MRGHDDSRAYRFIDEHLTLSASKANLSLGTITRDVASAPHPQFPSAHRSGTRESILKSGRRTQGTEVRRRGAKPQGPLRASSPRCSSNLLGKNGDASLQTWHALSRKPIFTLFRNGPDVLRPTGASGFFRRSGPTPSTAASASPYRRWRSLSLRSLSDFSLFSFLPKY